MPIDVQRWEVVRGHGPEGRFVELWDRSLAPGGLALEIVEDADGAAIVAGHEVVVPLEVATEFLSLANTYFSKSANRP